MPCVHRSGFSPTAVKLPATSEMCQLSYPAACRSAVSNWHAYRSYLVACYSVFHYCLMFTKSAISSILSFPLLHRRYLCVVLPNPSMPPLLCPLFPAPMLSSYLLSSSPQSGMLNKQTSKTSFPWQHTITKCPRRKVKRTQVKGSRQKGQRFRPRESAGGRGVARGCRCGRHHLYTFYENSAARS